MKIISKKSDLRSVLFLLREENKSVGLVPTMGALHAGHASLVERSLKDNDVTIVSVFVNPTQFNDKSDLEKYPRTLDSDCQLLSALCEETQTDGAQLIVFAPSVEEMYPEEDKRVFSYPPTDAVMEGQYRPGHFNGVCQIVSKLFMVVEPDRAYFGEKDFQQIAVIKRMVDDLQFAVQIVECPIVREKDGLALSSRNTLLSEKERAVAVNISRVLRESLTYMNNHTLQQTHDWVVSEINNVEGLQVQYFDIVDGDTLNRVEHWDDSSYVVGCITVFCGAIPVRLIDNIKYITDNDD